jgi:hypothetical protein
MVGLGTAVADEIDSAWDMRRGYEGTESLTAPPRLRVTLFLSRQPEGSCGTLVRDRIRCGLDRFSYADAAASLFS